MILLFHCSQQTPYWPLIDLTYPRSSTVANIHFLMTSRTSNWPVFFLHFLGFRFFEYWESLTRQTGFFSPSYGIFHQLFLREPTGFRKPSERRRGPTGSAATSLPKAPGPKLHWAIWRWKVRDPCEKPWPSRNLRREAGRFMPALLRYRMNFYIIL